MVDILMLCFTMVNIFNSLTYFVNWNYFCYFRAGLYEIRRSKLTNEPLKSAREIGNILFSKSAYVQQPSKIANIGGLFFGQYIAHDLSLLYFTPINNGGLGMRCCSADYTERLANNIMDYGCLPIDISSDDDYYSQYNMTCMELIRTAPMLPRNCRLGAAEPVWQKNQFKNDSFQIYLIHNFLRECMSHLIWINQCCMDILMSYR